MTLNTIVTFADVQWLQRMWKNHSVSLHNFVMSFVDNYTVYNKNSYYYLNYFGYDLTPAASQLSVAIPWQAPVALS